jgi:hypothetical protein
MPNKLKNWWRVQMGEPTVEEEALASARRRADDERNERIVAVDVDAWATPHDWDGHLPGDCPACGAT